MNELKKQDGEAVFTVFEGVKNDMQSLEHMPLQALNWISQVNLTPRHVIHPSYVFKHIFSNLKSAVIFEKVHRVEEQRFN